MSRQAWLNAGNFEADIDDALEIRFLREDFENIPAVLSDLAKGIKALQIQIRCYFVVVDSYCTFDSYFTFVP